jgi:hypothetical protein
VFFYSVVSGGESKSDHHGKNEFKILKPQMAIVCGERERERERESSRLFVFWHLCLDNEYNKNNNNA